MTTVVKPDRTQVRLAPSLSAGVAIATIAIVALALLRLASAGAPGVSYTVNELVATHVMAPNDVASKVMAQLAGMGGPNASAKILSMTVTTSAAAADIEPHAGRPPADSPDAKSIVWLVRAEGTFVGLRVPPGAKPIVGTTGYFMIDDATGDVIGMGMP